MILAAPVMMLALLQTTQQYAPMIVVAESRCLLPGGIPAGIIYRHGWRVSATEVVFTSDVGEPCREAASKLGLSNPPAKLKTQIQGWISSGEPLALDSATATPLVFQRNLPPVAGLSAPALSLYEFTSTTNLPAMGDAPAPSADFQDTFQLRYEGLPADVAIAPRSGPFTLGTVKVTMTDGGAILGFAERVEPSQLGSPIINPQGLVAVISGSNGGVAPGDLDELLRSPGAVAVAVPVTVVSAPAPIPARHENLRTLRVETTPAGATILVNGKPQPSRSGEPFTTSNADLQLHPGTYKLTACHDGYRCAYTEIALKDKDLMWRVTLQK